MRRKRFSKKKQLAALASNKFHDFCPMLRSREMKKNVIGGILLAVAAASLCACATVEDPEDPGFNKPAVAGVLDGEITTWEDYGSALEKENRRANREGGRWNDGFSDEF